MPLEENRALPLRYQRGWAANDHVMIDEICDEAIAVHYSHAPGPVVGRAALKEILDGVQHTFPDLTIEIHQIVAEGDVVALHWTMQGSHHDRRASWTGQNMVRIHDGKITEDFGVDDGLGMLRQLGVHTIPGASG